MTMRTRLTALGALAAAGLVIGTVTGAPAGAAVKASASPAFLSAAQLPPHPTSSWTAGKVTGGVPDQLLLCFPETFAGYDSSYREFWTDLDTNARQLTVVVKDEAKAKSLAARLNKELKKCATTVEQSNPGTDAEVRDYGTLPVEEGAHVYGLHTTTSFGADDVRLLSVGRDGHAVTVVEWAALGDFGAAPVTAFKKTTTTAVNKLY
jgi:hypothetical protein